MNCRWRISWYRSDIFFLIIVLDWISHEFLHLLFRVLEASNIYFSVWQTAFQLTSVWCETLLSSVLKQSWSFHSITPNYFTRKRDHKFTSFFISFVLPIVSTSVLGECLVSHFLKWKIFHTMDQLFLPTQYPFCFCHLILVLWKLRLRNKILSLEHRFSYSHSVSYSLSFVTMPNTLLHLQPNTKLKVLQIY